MNREFLTDLYEFAKEEAIGCLQVLVVAVCVTATFFIYAKFGG